MGARDPMCRDDKVGMQATTDSQLIYRARGGLSGEVYPWSDNFADRGKWQANSHAGNFPNSDTGTENAPGCLTAAGASWSIAR